MERNENVMLRWMCGVTLRDKVPTVELRRRLGVEGVVEVMRRGRLRWFGHVERKEVDDWVSTCRNLEVAGSRGRGRPRMTWRARLDGDMKDMGLRPEMAMDKRSGGVASWGECLTRISAETTDVKKVVVVVVVVFC